MVYAKSVISEISKSDIESENRNKFNEKYQIPSTKKQTNTNYQFPMFQTFCFVFWSLEF